MSDGGSYLDVDAALDLLSDRRRRYAVYYLARETDGVARFEEIVDFLVAELDPSARERVAVSLCHRHLPRLDAHGVVEYDEVTATVRYWCDPVLEDFVELTAEYDRR